MPRKLVKLVGFDYEEDEGEVQFRDGVQTAEITLLGWRRRHTQRAMMILTSIFAPSYPSKLWMHDSCIADMNDVYGPALGLWRDRLLRLTVLPKKRGERSDRFQVVLEDLFSLVNSQSFDSLV